MSLYSAAITIPFLNISGSNMPTEEKQPRVEVDAHNLGALLEAIMTNPVKLREMVATVNLNSKNPLAELIDEYNKFAEAYNKGTS